MVDDFEIIPHTADLKIRVYGHTLAEFFLNAVVGMFQSIGPKASDCKIEDGRRICRELPEHHEVEVKSFDLNSLLVDFLSEALYLSDVHDEAYLNATIYDINEKHVKATLRGVKITGFEIEIKAVTYHDLEIKRVDDIWQADIVFDV
ncbi:archease [Candidatus Dependentiae bacterium]|nr:MAG: archease [Candidatus Dependentiae bacterium]